MSDTKYFIGLILYWSGLILFFMIYSLAPLAQDSGEIKNQDILNSGFSDNLNTASIDGTNAQDTGILQAIGLAWEIVKSMFTLGIFISVPALNLMVAVFHGMLFIITIYLGVRVVRGV